MTVRVIECQLCEIFSLRFHSNPLEELLITDIRHDIGVGSHYSHLRVNLFTMRFEESNEKQLFVLKTLISVQATLQFCFTKPIMAIITLVLQPLGYYSEGNFRYVYK